MFQTKKEKSGRLEYDLHFWIGKESSQDEYGAVAVKAVELDQMLGDVPVQHREIQDHESKLFKSYFDELMSVFFRQKCKNKIYVNKIFISN